MTQPYPEYIPPEDCRDNEGPKGGWYPTEEDGPYESPEEIAEVLGHQPKAYYSYGTRYPWPKGLQ